MGTETKQAKRVCRGCENTSIKEHSTAYHPHYSYLHPYTLGSRCLANDHPGSPWEGDAAYLAHRTFTPVHLWRLIFKAARDGERYLPR